MLLLYSYPTRIEACQPHRQAPAATASHSPRKIRHKDFAIGKERKILGLLVKTSKLALEAETTSELCLLTWDEALEAMEEVQKIVGIAQKVS